MLAACLLAWATCAFYTLAINPEVTLAEFAVQKKLTWANQSAFQNKPRFLVFGGSSSAFSISPSLALSNEVPMVNFALGAGLGFKVITRFTLLHARAGDTLVMTMESGLLSDSGEITLNGAQTSVALKQPQLASESFDPSPHLNDSITSYFWSLRPGAYHAFTMLGKIALRKPLFRYSKDEVQDDGHQITFVRLTQEQIKAPMRVIQPRLSPDARLWLTNLRDYCQKHSLRLVYALPWTLTRPQDANLARQQNTRFLLEVSEIIPVLKDESLGVHTNADHYADTHLHMNQDGTVIRTLALVDSIKKWRFWNAEELKSVKP